MVLYKCFKFQTINAKPLASLQTVMCSSRKYPYLKFPEGGGFLQIKTFN